MGRRPRVDRAQVLSAAREVFAERGFEGATLAAIAGRIGLSPAALLRHAPTKDELFSHAMAPAPNEIATPLEFLSGVDAKSAEPRAVLSDVALRLEPFLAEKMGQTIALWLRANALAQGGAAARPESLPLLFDRDRRPTPPERALGLLENYLRRARRAGRVELDDPRAAALAFLATVHAYVTLHRIARILEPPLPFDRYLATVLDVWSRGIVRKGKEKR